MNTLDTSTKPIPKNRKSERMTWLDCLRLLAGVSMVGLHSSSDPNGQPFPAFDTIERIGPVLFRSVVYLARTELFLIISLFLLCLSLEKRPRGYGATIKEQATRLLIPFTFWVLFYAFYRLIKARYFGYDDALWVELSQPLEWVKYLLLGTVQYHMHFLPTLFGLVLIYPLYRIAMNNPLLGLIIFICLFAKREIDVFLWSNLREWVGFEFLLRFVKVITYAGYGIVAAAFAGMVLRGTTSNQRKDLGWAAAYLLLAFYAIKLVYSAKVIQSGNWQYNYVPAYWADFLIPALIFGVCFSLSKANWPKVISRMAPYSFGIYLVHPIFLDLLEILLWKQTLSPIVFVMIKFIVAVFFSSLLVFLLRSSGFLGWTVGLGKIPFTGGSRAKRRSNVNV